MSAVDPKFWKTQAAQNGVPLEVGCATPWDFKRRQGRGVACRSGASSFICFMSVDIRPFVYALANLLLAKSL